MNENEYQWKIVDIKAETPSVNTLYLECLSKRPEFIAGQYLTVKLPGHDPVEGKAYSISSAPYQHLVSITVKRLHNYSLALLKKQIGDIIVTSPPYGFFYPEAEDTGPLVFLAGGIGITPCVSIIAQLLHEKDPRPLYLYYSNQKLEEIAFAKKLADLKQTHPNFSLTTFLTREESVCTPHHTGRMTAERVLSSMNNSKAATFFLCGSQYFAQDLWRQLKDIGVAPEQIYTEGFF